MTNLATPAQVLDATGVSVAAKDITRAQAVIEAVTGRDLSGDTAGYRARDLRLLTSAVVWQTAYLDEHPELLVQAGNIASASTNGNSIAYGDGGSAGSLVAPLAEASLRRLSWRRSRAVRLRRRPETYRPQTLTNDGVDADWKPLR